MLSTHKENDQKLNHHIQLQPKNIIYSAIFITVFLWFFAGLFLLKTLNSIEIFL